MRATERAVCHARRRINQRRLAAQARAPDTYPETIELGVRGGVAPLGQESIFPTTDRGAKP